MSGCQIMTRGGQRSFIVKGTEGGKESVAREEYCAAVCGGGRLSFPPSWLGGVVDMVIVTRRRVEFQALYLCFST